MFGIAYLERVKATGELNVVDREIVREAMPKKAVVGIAEKALLSHARATGYQISENSGKLIKERLPPG